MPYHWKSAKQKIGHTKIENCTTGLSRNYSQLQVEYRHICIHVLTIFENTVFTSVMQLMLLYTYVTKMAH
jgi:hypothetical protein